MIPHGYVAYTGKRLHDHDVDDYNNIRKEIDAKRAAMLPISEWLLDWSHRKFVEISTIHKEN